MPQETQITGVLERIVFSNEENHFTVGELRLEKERRLVTFSGQMPGVQCGETLALNGDWVTHPVHGDQFKAKSFNSKLPATVYGIKKYLGSGLIKNIGPKNAERIVDHFGVDTLRIINEESARLKEVPGVGQKRAKEIKAAWDEQYTLRDVMMFLQTYGVSNSLCLRLIKTYGNEAKQILQNEPYRVAREIPGIGFKTADKIAVNLGYSNESPPRLDAGIVFALQTLESEGHSCFVKSQLILKAAEMLEVSPALLQPRVETLIQQKAVLEIQTTESAESISLQLPNSHRAESVIADSIIRLSCNRSGLPSIKVDKAVIWAEEKAGFQFAVQQSAGVAAALKSKVSILTGGPGTGKTTILRAVVEILKAKKTKIILAAPSGRAAQRMSESARAFAQTIHRLLRFDPSINGFAVNADSPLKADFVIVDEASMLDNKLAASLIRAIPNNCHLLLVGDINQLPSVGSGNVLKDIIEFAESYQSSAPGYSQPSVTRLEKIFRQQEQSSIVSVAHGILAGNAGAPSVSPDLNSVDPKYDLHFIKAEDAETCVETTVKLCSQYLPRWFRKLDPLMDIQVLPPMHKGVGGIGNFNRQLQNALNPNAMGVSLGNTRFSVGDKVIQTRNNYDKGIFNGDLGRVTAVNVEAGTVAVDFDDNIVDFERAEMIDLHLAYAISIHKSQGSEFPIVIVPLLKAHFVMLQRNLLYTGITRGRRKVFIVGDPVAYAMAVRNHEATARQTGLQAKMRDKLVYA